MPLAFVTPFRKPILYNSTFLASEILISSFCFRFRNEPNYAATLASIIVIFIICHLPRILKNIYEIVFTNALLSSGVNCLGVNPAKCLVHINNFILAINASAGFIIYCFVGTFGDKFVQVLTSCCKQRQSEFIFFVFTLKSL